MTQKALNTKDKKPNQLAFEFTVIDQVLDTEHAKCLKDVHQDIQEPIARQKSTQKLEQQTVSKPELDDTPRIPEFISSKQTPQKEGQIKVRYSMRAKRMSISVNHKGNAEAVVPGKKYRRPSLKRIRNYVSENKAWIEKTIQQYRATHTLTESANRPTEIQLNYLDKTVRIHYVDSLNQKKRQIKEIDGQIHIASELNDAQVAEKLGAWLAKLAKTILLPELDRLATHTGLKHSKASIRGQKSRWGSCSSKGNISLNYCILLLPKRHGRYVLIHELCHLQEFNHSRRFWNLVKQFEPDYRQLDKNINDLWVKLPSWLDLRFLKTSTDDVIYIDI